MKYFTCAVVVLLLSLLSISAWAQPVYDDESALFVTNRDAINEEISSSYTDVVDNMLSQSTRNARHAPFLAGALVGAGVANHHHHPSYYYPPTYYYPSSGYYNNGYYYSG